MATKVSYKQGAKSTYLGLINRDPYALYFCTDTKELFRGDDLYSDGVRFVESYSALPSFLFAADGILYFCKDNGCGYVLSESRDEWVPVIYGIDNSTIILNDGLLSVGAIPINSVSGLSDKLQEITDQLEERLTEIETAIVGGIIYRGAVDTFDQLPTDASTGDLYEVYEDNSEWCWNGTQWFEFGKGISFTSENYIPNEEQFTLSNNVFTLTKVEAVAVYHNEKPLDEIIDDIFMSITWEDMA